MRLYERIVEPVRPNVYLLETGPDLSIQEAQEIALYLRDARGWTVLIDPTPTKRKAHP